MKAIVISFCFVILFHVGLLLFGRALFPKPHKEEKLKVTEVDLTENTKEKEPEETKEKVEEKVEAPPEQMVDAKVFQDAAPADAPPALSAMSLSDLAGALNGAAGESFFGGGGSLQGGGVIGGSGTGGFGGDAMESALSGSEVDERPQMLGAPNIKLPPELRKAKGKVVVRLIVDATGSVKQPQVETSSNSALNTHVIAGLRDARFEPAKRNGKAVSCKVRLPISLGA
jgi:TonB family protein